jgi:predicted nucleotidyltransferase
MNRFPATVPLSEIAQFCRRWRIRELALFGSALRDDFRADSDLDFLVTFAADADWGLLDHIQMEQELQALLQRDVDLVTRRALERSQNWVRRQEILGTAQTLFSEQGAVHASG